MRAWLRCRSGLLLCALAAGSLDASGWAEETALTPETSIYAGAVAADLNAVTASQLLLTNPKDIANVPLREVIAQIEEITDLQVRIDWSSVTDAGMDLSLDTNIPEWPAGASVRQFLQSIPESQRTELTWVVEGQLLLLMTSEKAEERYQTQRYYIGDLLAKDTEPMLIIDILTQETAGPWDSDEPGTGTVTPFGNHLVIRQTLRQHLAVQGILEALRRSEPIVLIGLSPEDLQLRKMLEDELVSFDSSSISLGEFAQEISQMIGARLILDEQALEDAGLDKECKIDARAKNLPLGIALRTNLSNVNGTELTVVVEDGAIKVTSQEKACEKYETVRYNVGSLGITGDRLHEFVALLKIETTGPWDDDEPGTGTISVYPYGNSLIVRQTPWVHREILELLRDLRTLPPEQRLFAAAPAKDNGICTKYYGMAPETAEALSKVIPQSIAPGTWNVEFANVAAVPAEQTSKEEKPILRPAPPSPSLLPGHLMLVEIPERGRRIHMVDPTRGHAPSAAFFQFSSQGMVGGTEKMSAECYLAVTHNSEVHASVARLIQALHGLPLHSTPTRSGGGGGGFFGIPGRE